MTIETLQEICKSFPATTEDIKWENDLVFSVGGKMYLVIGLNSDPVTASFKVSEEDFEELTNKEGFRPAPYLAKHKWVLIEDISLFKKKEWLEKARGSYDLIKAKLTSRLRQQLGI